jgi:hypothetical protein
MSGQSHLVVSGPDDLRCRVALTVWSHLNQHLTRTSRINLEEGL